MAMGQMQKTIKLNVKVSEELWPYQVVDEIQKVMEEGLKKHPDGDGWKHPINSLVASAEEHLCEYFQKGGNKSSEDHLVRAFTDLMMAVAIERGYANPVTKDEEYS